MEEKPLTWGQKVGYAIAFALLVALMYVEGRP